MTIDQTFTLFLTTYALLAAIMAGGFTLVFMELHRVHNKLDKIDDRFGKIDEKFDKLRVDLAEEFRAQRAEVSAQTTALANAIISARR